MGESADITFEDFGASDTAKIRKLSHTIQAQLANQLRHFSDAFSAQSSTSSNVLTVDQNKNEIFQNRSEVIFNPDSECEDFILHANHDDDDLDLDLMSRQNTSLNNNDGQPTRSTDQVERYHSIQGVNDATSSTHVIPETPKPQWETKKSKMKTLLDFHFKGPHPSKSVGDVPTENVEDISIKLSETLPSPRQSIYPLLGRSEVASVITNPSMKVVSTITENVLHTSQIPTSSKDPNTTVTPIRIGMTQCLDKNIQTSWELISNPRFVINKTPSNPMSGLKNIVDGLLVDIK